MRTLVRERQQELGVYASVVEPARCACGDEVELLA